MGGGAPTPSNRSKPASSTAAAEEYVVAQSGSNVFRVLNFELYAGPTMMDVFQYCRFLRHAGKIMVLFVLALTALSYYAVLTELAAAAQHASAPTRIVLLACAVAFSGLIFMLLWSYFTTVLTDPGRVPIGWHPFPDAEQGAHPDPNTTTTHFVDKGNVWRPRYCKKCRAWKPPRAHHCSVSGRCVLKMDHYCIWMVNTIGLLNYKAFVLFLLYTFAATTIATGILARSFVAFLRAPSGDNLGRPIALFLSFVVDVAFVLSLTGFLLIHLRLLTRNMTTIEHFEKVIPEQWPFDRGARRNLQEVFGRVPARWFVPGYTRQEVVMLCRGVLDAAQ